MKHINKFSKFGKHIKPLKSALSINLFETDKNPLLNPIFENMKQAEKILKDKGVTKNDTDFLYIKDMLADKGQAFLGLFVKFKYDENVVMSDIERVWNWMQDRQLVKKLPQPVLSYKTYEKLVDDINQIEYDRKVQTLFVELNSDQKIFLKDASQEDAIRFKNLANSIYKISNKGDFISSISRIKSMDEMIEMLEDFVIKNSDVDYPSTLLKIQKTDGANIEFQTDDKIVARVDTYEASKILGCNTWCIVTDRSQFTTYVTGTDNMQYFVWNFDQTVDNPNFLVGITVRQNGTIQNFQDSRNRSIPEHLRHGLIGDDVFKSILSIDPEEYTRLAKERAENRDEEVRLAEQERHQREAERRRRLVAVAQGRRENSEWDNDPIPHVLMEYLKSDNEWNTGDETEQEDLNNRIRILKQEIERKNTQVNNLEGNVADSNSRIRERLDQIEDTEDETIEQQIQSEIIRLQEDIDKWQEEIEAIDSDLEEVGENLEEVVEELSENSGDDVYALNQLEYDHYGMRLFEYDGKTWAVATDELADEAGLEATTSATEEDLSNFKHMIQNGDPIERNPWYLTDTIDKDSIASEYGDDSDYFREMVEESPDSYLDEDEDRELTINGDEIVKKYKELYSEWLKEGIKSEEEREGLHSAYRMLEEDLDPDELQTLLDEWKDVLQEKIDKADEDGDTTKEMEIQEIWDMYDKDYDTLGDEDELFQWSDSAIDDKIEELNNDKQEEIKQDPLQYFKDQGIPFDWTEYVDVEEATKTAISSDGRHHMMSIYDGEEHDVNYNGETYYIYRTG